MKSVREKVKSRPNKWFNSRGPYPHMYTHFKNLLGNPPNVLEEDEDISNILTGVNIDDGSFTMHELKKVKILMLPQTRQKCWA